MIYTFPVPLRLFLAAAPPDAIPMATASTWSWSAVILPLDDDGQYELRVYAADDGSLDHVSVHEATHNDGEDTEREPGWHTTLLDSYLTIGQALRLCHDYRKENDRRRTPLPL